MQTQTARARWEKCRAVFREDALALESPMIKYRLNCASGHEFEAWFRSSSAYDSQERRGHVSCPACGSTEVKRAIMAPSVATSRRRQPDTTTARPAQLPAAAAPPESGEFPARFLRVMRELRREVESKAEYVGPRFAEEARKIYYDEAAPRGIYGEASLADAKDLLDEGIAVLPLPKLPEEEN